MALAPHLTEVVYFLGLGQRLVGRDASSDFPPAATQVAVVGDAFRFDVEALLVLKPDLVLAWGSGISAGQLALLEKADVPVFVSEPGSLAAVHANFQKIARLVQADATAFAKIDQWQRSLSDMFKRAHTNTVPAVRVFYQVWDQPLMTLNGKHVLSELISKCGGINIFANQPVLAPQVGEEAVLALNPQLLLNSGIYSRASNPLQRWQKWPNLEAVQRQQLHTLPPDILVRPGPRLLGAARLVCGVIQQARVSRAIPGGHAEQQPFKGAAQ
ncbi:MAG: ABC transporter substrate-binding protein [Limnobacter sp.]|nr:ABC transporter substrate-binding protein [Limnobacter sp.]